MKKADRFLVLTLVVALFALGASAQSFTATLVGKVSDPGGAIVPGATVTVTKVDTNQTRTATTNDGGEYLISQLAPGTYKVTIGASGFKSTINQNVVLETDITRRVDVKLDVGSISESVTVEAEPPVVNTESSEKAEVITPRQVQDLPLNGRNYTDLALLVPGVYPRPSDDDQGQGVAASGSRTDATNFILDGTTNRSDRNGGVAITAGLDSIREFKVSTSNYSAEYGKVAGAQINVVSKSGTNRFSGTLFEYIRNDAFDANDVFATEDAPKTLRRHQFGGTIGGPLPFFNFGEGGPVLDSGKDKTFFFASYERTLQTRTRSAQSTAPNADWLRGDFRNAGITLRCLSRNNTTQAVTKVTCPTPNVIPMNDIVGASSTILGMNPVSKMMLEFLPAANVPGSQSQYRATLPGENNNHQFLAKFDRKVNDRNNFYFRYTKENKEGTDPFPSSRNFYPGFGRTNGTDSFSWAFGDS
ncbi:MAG TPA: carboxypeptidase-like regulatory domain-containing protein, partial [Pyrinomonadaceae bacterium]|nr:carboxypeptidase-like regulatory domain-containing protein [Pyrinomonadaceae bacterium]